MKRFNDYWRTIWDPGGGGIEGFSTMGIDGDGGGGTQYEYFSAHSEWHYLYDGDVLVAIFDENDNPEQVYVNGVDGQIAVYDVNYSPRLFYFLKDQVGSNRAMVNSDGVMVEYRNYHPFGEVMESWISYDEPLEYTGKERDKHRTFDYTYFGARYYDPELGVFSTIDKAGQSASGFTYCGNDPILNSDLTGYWFGIDDLIISATTFVFSYLQYAAETGDFGKAFGHATASAFSSWIAYNTGGIIAKNALGLTGTAEAVGSATATGAIGGSLGSFTNQMAVMAMKEADMRGFDWSDIGIGGLAGGAGGFAGGLWGQHISHDLITPSFPGAAISSAFSRTDFMKAITWNVGETITTASLYSIYGEIKTKNHFPKGVDNEMDCHTFRAGLLEEGDKFLYWDGVSVEDRDIYVDGKLEVRAGEESRINHVHSGVPLGRTKYGQTVVLSKLAAGEPVTVQTARSLDYHFRGIDSNTGKSHWAIHYVSIY